MREGEGHKGCALRAERESARARERERKRDVGRRGTEGVRAELNERARARTREREREREISSKYEQ